MAQLMSIKKNVDVQPGVGVPAIFHCSQGDKGTRIILGLLNNNDSYTIPEGTTAIIRGSRADGTLFTEIAADIDTTTEIKFNLTEDMTSVAGPVECEAVMSSGSANVIGTANFIINVEKSPASIGSVIPGTDAAETWLIDELTNLDLSGLDNESVVDAINSKANESTIAPEFDSSDSYTAGSYVYKNGVLYRFTATHSGAWTGSDAEVVTVGGEVIELKSDIGDKVDVSMMQKCEEVTEASINRWDSSTVTTGLLHTNGNVYTGGNYDAYCYNGIGTVSEGDVITAFKVSGNLVVAQNMERVVAYDSNDTVLSSAGAIAVNTYTVPNGVAKIKVTVNKTISDAHFMVLINHSTPIAYIPYTGESVYYVATPEFIGEINVDTQTDFDEKMLDFSMVNRVVPSECETGKFLNGATGAISDNASYFVTGYMPIHKDETLYLFLTYTLDAYNFRTIAAYDANRNIISTYGVNTESPSITYSEGMAYIRASILLSNGTGGTWSTPNTVMVVANPKPSTVSTNNSSPKIKSEYTRKKVYIYSTDSETTIIEKMVSAYFTNDCDVIFERSHYTFGTVLPNITSLYNLSRVEIPVGNNCRYYFNGATLEAEFDLSDLGSDFIGSLLGTQYKPTNFEMHDGILIATDTRYVMHDEASALEGSYKHLYQNMYMEYRTNDSTDVYRKCIGGGTGADGVVEIVGCKFVTDASEVCVSYHGNSRDIVGAEFMLSIRDSWFSNGARAGELSAHQTGRAFFVGNSSANAFQTYDRWNVTSFNNEIRS